ncbi:hypothetical protein HK097_005151 [Rhizophlyctis rosea]|uniref:Uncharacterized protein n=1 Tax=Rhizophlyctis rosea TaxID=64517 RepID=A0AAD5S0U1_9FUNG|nr:hypothetical protein HK097_005151 [Rhizophlyctis rosea]
MDRMDTSPSPAGRSRLPVPTGGDGDDVDFVTKRSNKKARMECKSVGKGFSGGVSGVEKGELEGVNRRLSLSEGGGVAKRMAGPVLDASSPFM